MQILHLLNEVNEGGNGMVNVAVDLACVQAKRGHTVTIAAAGAGYSSLLSSAGVRHVIFPHRFSMRNPAGIAATARAALQLRRLTKSLQPDIVHCHMTAGLLLAAASRGNRNFHVVSHLHNVHESKSVLLRLADKTVAVSEAVADQMLRWGFQQDKIAVVKNGTLGSARLAFRAKPISLLQPAIVTVAGLTKRKNVDGLIAAFNQISNKFPDANLYIVGDGDDRTSLQAYARSTPAANRIHFEGFQEDPRPFLNAAEVFVLASHRESFGLVLQEARAAGAPIIASNVDGIPEALDYGRAGVLVPVGDVSKLASAIASLLSNDTFRSDLRRKALENLESHTVEYMCDQMDAVYASLPPRRSIDGGRDVPVREVIRDRAGTA